MAIETPKFDLKAFGDVYEPSEDSFLLIDAFESELKHLKCQKPEFILEIGSGSGIVSTALATVLKNCSFFATDLNLNACLATKSTSLLNNVHNIEPVCMNLASNFRPNLFDVIIFNPPYVVTSPDEVKGTGLNRAWAGGYKGREIIDQLIPNIPHLLNNTTGIFYLLLLKENKPSEVTRVMSSYGYSHEIVRERKILGEYLYIFKFFKSLNLL